ncbi:YeeE/YedE family protein [Rheinheimera sp. NSM]|uniref:YeeE/YedE family protein n=1 Tax=Rheinheimera sp. NSM TaxID=3457884 RepID=UPI004036F841
MDNFTPIAALVGGSIIGLGALILFVFSGRIAGISGIAAAALFSAEGRSWRLAFLAGIIAGPLLVGTVISDFSYSTPQLSWQVIVAGLLVGIGTGWGSGCTSGHGICGISRLSPRSITATVLFMFSGMLVATLLR